MIFSPEEAAQCHGIQPPMRSIQEDGQDIPYAILCPNRHCALPIPYAARVTRKDAKAHQKCKFCKAQFTPLAASCARCRQTTRNCLCRYDRESCMWLPPLTLQQAVAAVPVPYRFAPLRRRRRRLRPCPIKAPRPTSAPPNPLPVA